MKKTLAILLALALVFSSITVSFAEETLPVGAQAAKDLGMLVGDGSGVSLDYLKTTPTRIQAAVMVLRLKGLEDDAKAFTGTANFADANTAAWAAPIMAYLNATPAVGFQGVGNNNFNPTGKMDAKSYYKVMLETLGYKYGTDFTWDNVLTFAADKKLSAVANVANFTVNDLATATIETLKANVAGGTTTLAAKLVAENVITKEAAAKAGLVSELAVESVKATTAKSFVVKFNRAVTEEDKVTVAVNRLTTPVTTTTTWNADKTEATVASASNFAEATFTVVAKADTKTLASENITITAQKVAKIEFTSKAVAVNVSTGDGYVNYKVYDQYNNDITNHYLANALTFKAGVGTETWKNGSITISPVAPATLIQYQNISIIGYDNTGVTATVSLPTSTTMGTLSDFALGSVEDLKLVDGDITSLYYIPYTAKDMSGNDTKDYDLVAGGLIFNPSYPNELVVSLSNNVEAKVVHDPANSNHAAIQVKVKPAAAIPVDMPVTITAMTYAGKTSTVQTTLAKAKVLNNITLLAPSATVAANETPEIGFEAYDQHGNRITRYSEIAPFVNSPQQGFTIEEKVDGTAKFVMTGVPKGLTTLSVVVSATGKMSTLNINVQDTAKPSRLAIDNSVLVAAMEDGATQSIGLVGSTPKGIKVYDQYDREMSKGDITANFEASAGVTVGKYHIAITNNTNQVGIDTAEFDAGDDVLGLTATAAAGGSDSVKFTLKERTATGFKIHSEVTASMAVIKTVDIVDYTMSTFDKPIYASINANTAQEQAYKAEVEVYGKTRGGAKVILAGTPILGSAVENAVDFAVLNGSGAWDAVTIVANATLTPARPSATTLVSVNLFHNDKVSALTTNLESSYVAPTAKTIVATASTGYTLSEDKMSLTVAQFNGMSTKSLVLFDGAGAATATLSKAPFTFKITDSYGKTAMLPAQFKINIVKANVANTTAMTVSTTPATYGIITASGATAGDVVYVTGITNNGLIKTVKITITP